MCPVPAELRQTTPGKKCRKLTSQPKFSFAAHRSSSLGLRFVTCRPLHLRLKKQEDHAVMAHQLTPRRIFFQVACKFNARGDFPVAVFRVLFKKGCGIVLL